MLRERAQQFVEGRDQTTTRAIPESKASPIFLAANPYFAIVDGELVNVLGTTDIPGMSPAYWCSDNVGHSAPVSFRQARIFPTAQQALQFLEAERGNIGREGGLNRLT